MPPSIIRSSDAPAPIGPYSQATCGAGLVFLSGQIPLDPRTGEMVGGDAAAQAQQVLENLRAVLHASGSALERVVRTTIYLVDLGGDFSRVNEVYAKFFAERPPARTTIGVQALPRGARVEIDAVALIE
jgi:2-iminobutanoate/2-iminopropanoate deaminase